MDSNSIFGFSHATDALIAFSKGIQAPAHNVANISTDNFKQITPVFSDGPGGNGVRLSAIVRHGVPVQEEMTQPGLSGNVYSRVPSETELAREIPAMINMQRSFQANAQTIRTLDEMTGSLLNILA